MLDASFTDNHGMFKIVTKATLIHLHEQQAISKLKLSTLSHLDIVSDDLQQLLDILKERRDHSIGLQKLAVRSCYVHEVEHK